MANTTADKLNALRTTKQMIRQAIIDRDVAVPEDTTFREYASKIEEIGDKKVKNQDKTITKNGQYTADEGYTGLGTVTVQVPQEGDVVESIALGTATTAQEGDKVLLNPAIALQNPITLDYTKTANSYWRVVNNTRNAPNVGVFSSTKGYAEMLHDGGAGLDVNFAWDSEQNKYISVNQPTSYSWSVVWGTPKQMYYATCSYYVGYIYGDVGTVSPDLSFNPQGTLSDQHEPMSFLSVYKNYFSRGNLGFTHRITDTGIETVSKGSTSAYGFVEYNNVIYTTGNFSSSVLNGYSFENTTIQIAGLPSAPNEITCLDSNSNYIIAGPYGSPYQFKIFKQLDTSDATHLRLQEDTELTAQLPINTEAQTDCNFYVIPIQDGQDWADIFIRYGGRLFYCKWDGTTLTNYGLVTDRGNQFSFNPVERILFTNRAIVEDNTSDYQVFSFQGVMNKPFTAMDVTSKNWSTQTLTGFVKENAGQDEFGNTILKVNTVLDPNEEPWSDVGKLYGFNVKVEAGSNE